MRIAIASVLWPSWRGLQGVRPPRPSTRPDRARPSVPRRMTCRYHLHELLRVQSPQLRRHDRLARTPRGRTRPHVRRQQIDERTLDARKPAARPDTCHRDADTAAYWVPTLFDPAGHAVEPVRTVIYYRRRTVQPAAAFPAGLRMIAGDAHATEPQLGVASWDCGFSGSYTRTPYIPTCPPGRRTMLALHVAFPNCWNGRDLDSADHRSHMAYGELGLCPPSHPVEVPTINLNLRYPVRGGPGVRAGLRRPAQRSR